MKLGLQSMELFVPNDTSITVWIICHATIDYIKAEVRFEAYKFGIVLL